MKKKELAARVVALEAQVASLQAQLAPQPMPMLRPPPTWPVTVTYTTSANPVETARSMQRMLVRLKRESGGARLGLA